MKNALAAFALSMFSPAVAFAQTSSASDAIRYYQADSAISVGALVLAAAVMMAANIGERRKRTRLAVAAKPAWRQQMMRNLEADLQLFSRQLRRAA